MYDKTSNNRPQQPPSQPQYDSTDATHAQQRKKFAYGKPFILIVEMKLRSMQKKKKINDIWKDSWISEVKKETMVTIAIPVY